jgi:hypothetical protein
MASRRGEGATWDETMTLGDSLAIMATSEQVAQSGAHNRSAIEPLIVRFHAAYALKNHLTSLQLAVTEPPLSKKTKLSLSTMCEILEGQGVPCCSNASMSLSSPCNSGHSKWRRALYKSLPCVLSGLNFPSAGGVG